MRALHIPLLAAIVAAHAFAQGIRLPPVEPEVEKEPAAGAQKVQGDFERFRARLADLAAAGRNAEVVIDNLGREFFGPGGDPDGLLRRGARILRGSELDALARVAARWGSAAVGHDLALQLQVREVGRTSAAVVMDAVVELLGDDAPRTLLDLARSKRAPVRAAAMERLTQRVSELEFQDVLSFANDRSLDARRNGVQLLAALGTEEAWAQLVDMLSAHRARDLSISSSACQALIDAGRPVVPLLQKVLDGPPVDHAWAYSAFALAVIEARCDDEFLTSAHAETLARQLGGNDAVTRSLAAVPLAHLYFRGAVDGDAGAVVEVLLDVVAPVGYVPNLAMLQNPTDRALVLLSGREAPQTRTDWRLWWDGVSGEFAPMRESIEVAPDAVTRVQLRLRRGQSEVRLYGEGLAAMVDGQQGRDLLLAEDQMAELLKALGAMGFQSGELPEYTGPLEKVRTLELRVDGAGHRAAAPAKGAPWFDQLASVIDEVVEGERWQFFRHPEDEPDFDAFWRAERRWLAENTAPEARRGRLADRILKVWPVLDESRQQQEALQILLSLGGEGVIDEDRGKALVARVRQADSVGETELRLLELAMAAPGDGVWREALDLVDQMLERGLVGEDAGTRAAVVSNIFTLMGPDRVLSAVDDPRKRVRLGAIDEVVNMRLREAAPALLRAAASDDGEVRRAGVFALGILRIAEARVPIIELANDPDCPPYLREECLLALGRIGGDGVARMLRSVLALDDPRLVEAAVRGLGEMRDPEASVILAEVYADRHGDSIGGLSRLQLLQHGALRSIPAVRYELRRAEEPHHRRALLLLMGEMQAPEVVGDLIPMLAESDGTRGARLVAILEDTTGVDLAPENDRLVAMAQWYSRARSEPQAAWLVAALDRAGISHTLTVEKLTDRSDLSAVSELTRLLQELPIARLRVLVGAVLRDLTQLDFGLVTRSTPQVRLEELSRRYRALMDAQRAASGR